MVMTAPPHSTSLWYCMYHVYINFLTSCLQDNCKFSASRSVMIKCRTFKCHSSFSCLLNLKYQNRDGPWHCYLYYSPISQAFFNLSELLKGNNHMLFWNQSSNLRYMYLCKLFPCTRSSFRDNVHVPCASFVKSYINLKVMAENLKTHLLKAILIHH